MSRFQAFYNSKEWKQVRAYCMMRDKYLCVKCGQPAEEVHHIRHITSANQWDTSVTLNPDNLASLCRNCHFEQHRGEHARGLQSKNKIEGMIEYTFDDNGVLVPVES